MWRWGRLAALGFVAVSLSAPVPHKDGQAKQVTAKHKKVVQQQTFAPPPEQAEPVKPSEYFRPCRNDQADGNSELCAEWTTAKEAVDAASWAKRSFWISVFGLLGLLGTLFYTRKAVVAAEKATRDADSAIAVAREANEIARNAADSAYSGMRTQANAMQNAATAMERQNEIAEDVAAQQLRAYVSWVKFDLDLHRDANGRLVEAAIPLIWKNSGQTPARRLVDRISWEIFPGGLPPDFDFPEVDAEGPCDSLVLGPGQEFRSIAIRTLTPEEFVQLAAKKVRCFAWGAVSYTDAFNKRRRTEVATELVITPLKNGQHNISFNAIPQHSGMDEDCMRPPKE